MAPDSLAVELIAVILAVLAVVTTALTWDLGRGPRQAAVRAASAVLCVLTTAATALVWVDRQVETYTSWSDLAGTPQTVTAAAPEPERGPAATRGHGRIVAVNVAGRASAMTAPLFVYLPAAYDRQPKTRFPVIEALHGFPGSPLTWLHRLDMAAYLDREIAAGRMAPTVVLLPYQTPDPLRDTECTDLVGGPHAETFLTVDVPAAARAHLRIRTDRAAWGLIGYSAGGYCAMNLMLRHPTQYAAAASLSGYSDPGITIGDGTEHTLNNDAWRLQHLPVPAVALYLACARTDATAMRDTASLARLAHAPASTTTAFVGTGGHNDATWRAMEPPALDWISSWLAGPQPS
ncbi:alpha/beta hydrolase-fold protein [Actinoplanes sp. NPDC051475]|uniref:alpha/beta hydrolase n=1 Tax=Actinoplanes sp. NPDC051475 TaxID=3157225 RepID=UPI0034508109